MLETRPPWPVSARSGLALALGLAFLLLPQHGLWVDEAFSLALAGGHSLEQAPGAAPRTGDWTDGRTASAGEWAQWTDPAQGSIAAVPLALRQSDTSPPLYYLVLHAWARAFGSGDWALRALSLLAWLAGWLLLLRVAFARVGPPAWGASLALLALAPAGLWFATEGRMYALAGLWLALAAHAAERAEARDWRGWPAWTFAMGGAAAAWTHYFYLPAFLGLALGWMLLSRHRGRIAAYAALAPLALLPWMAAGAADISRWRVTEGWLLGRPSALALVGGPLWNAWQLLRGQGLWSSPSAPGWTLGSALAALALSLATWGLWRLRAKKQLPLLAWAAAALLTPLLFDLALGTHSSRVPRYALAALAPLALLLGAGLAALGPRVRVAALLALLCAWGLEARMPWMQRGRLDNPLRAAAQALGPLPEGAGLVVQSIPSGALGLCRYLPPTLPVLAMNGRLSPQPAEALAAFAAGRPLVVLIITHELDHGTPALDALQKAGRVVDERLVDSVRAIYFAPPIGISRFPSQRSTRREG